MRKIAYTGRAATAVAVYRAGFTLIELLVVLVILGLLAGIVAPNFIGQSDKARIDTTKTQIEQLSAALDMYRLEIGRYPNSSEGLDALIQAPSGAERWKGPYLKKKELPKDAWGNEFQYRSPGENGPFDIISQGPDGQEGSEDDVVSWN